MVDVEIDVKNIIGTQNLNQPVADLLVATCSTSHLGTIDCVGSLRYSRGYGVVYCDYCGLTYSEDDLQLLAFAFFTFPQDRPDPKRSRRTVAADRIDPWAIYDRCNWICYLCGLPVDKTIEPICSMSRSLDHIIPLDADSTPGHVSANLALAHHGCNSRKKNVYTQVHVSLYEYNVVMERCGRPGYAQPVS